MRRPLVILALLLLALTQCGILPPYATVPKTLSKAQLEAIKSSDGTVPSQIGVCYDALTTTAEQVRSIAEQTCDPGTVPRAIDRDYSLGNCPLLQPGRVTFACLAKTP